MLNVLSESWAAKVRFLTDFLGFVSFVILHTRAFWPQKLKLWQKFRGVQSVNSRSKTPCKIVLPLTDRYVPKYA